MNLFDISNDLVRQKLLDRQIEFSFFRQCYDKRLVQLQTQQQEFWREIQRFLSPEVVSEELTDKLWWKNFLLLLKDWGDIPIRQPQS